MKKVDTGLILGVGALIAVIVFGKTILNKLGLGKDQNDKNYDQYNDDPNSFWQPGFYDKSPSGSKLLPAAQCEKMWAQLNDAFGWFNDDETAAISVFKNNIKYQVQLAFFAWYVAKYKNVNLLQWLRGNTYPSDRLDTAEIREITAFVERLPKYK